MSSHNLVKCTSSHHEGELCDNKPTSEELVDELQKQSDASVAAKKSKILEALPDLNVVLSAIKSYDVDLATTLQASIPTAKQLEPNSNQSLTAQELATSIVQIYQALDQHRLQSDAKSKKMSKTRRSIARKAFQNAFNLFSGIVANAKESIKFQKQNATHQQTKKNSGNHRNVQGVAAAPRAQGAYAITTAETTAAPKHVASNDSSDLTSFPRQRTDTPPNVSSRTISYAAAARRASHCGGSGNMTAATAVSLRTKESVVAKENSVRNRGAERNVSNAAVAASFREGNPSSFPHQGIDTPTPNVSARAIISYAAAAQRTSHRGGGDMKTATAVSLCKTESSVVAKENSVRHHGAEGNVSNAAAAASSFREGKPSTKRDRGRSILGQRKQVLGGDNGDPRHLQLLKRYTNRIKNAPCWTKAVALLREMSERGGLQPGTHHYSAAITVCGRAGQKQRALELFHEMVDRGIAPNVFVYSSVINACAKKGDWEKAVSLLRTMQKQGVQPNVFCYNAAISACGKSGEWQKALDLLCGMVRRGIKPDVISYNAAISACEKGGQLQPALDLLREMEDCDIQPCKISYSAAISACEKSGESETALDLLREMEARGIQPDVISYSGAISACEKGVQWQKALDLLYEMEDRGIQPSEISYSAAISACGKGGEWQRALDLLREMEGRGFQPNEISYNAAISACEKGQEWQRALDLLREMEDCGIQPCKISYSAAISACGKGGEWQRALNLLRKMEDRGIQPNVISYSAAISACEKGGEWQKALDLLRKMEVGGIQPNEISYNAAISACEKGEQWQGALDLLHEMEDRGIEPNAISYSAAICACFNCEKFSVAVELSRESAEKGHFPSFAKRKKWDLHDLPLAVSCMLLADGLLTVIQDDLCKSESFKDIIVVTGKGLGSGPDGPVLQTQVPLFLKSNFGPEMEPVKGNDGAFLITRDSLRHWVEHGPTNFDDFKRRMTGITTEII